MQAPPVLHFALTDIVQVWLPVPIVNQIFRDMRRQKNVSGIPTVEDSLRNVDPRSCYVQSVVNVSNSIYRATVNSHSQLDARMATVESLMDRYHVDREQAGRVEKTVRDLLSQVADAWELPERRSSELCSWAARLHEIGIHIAHSGYHKHGAYILENSDLPGFSVQEQRVLATLVRAHRRKFPVPVFDALPARARTAKHLAILLRLSVLLCRSRSDAPPIRATASGRSLYIRFQEGWLEAHPLTVADLREESELLQSANFDLKFA